VDLARGAQAALTASLVVVKCKDQEKLDAEEAASRSRSPDDSGCAVWISSGEMDTETAVAANVAVLS